MDVNLFCLFIISGIFLFLKVQTRKARCCLLSKKLGFWMEIFCGVRPERLSRATFYEICMFDPPLLLSSPPPLLPSPPTGTNMAPCSLVSQMIDVELCKLKGQRSEVRTKTLQFLESIVWAGVEQFICTWETRSETEPLQHLKKDFLFLRLQQHPASCSHDYAVETVSNVGGSDSSFIEIC